MKLAGRYIFLITSAVLIVLNLSVWIQDNHAFSVKKVLISGISLLDARNVIEAADIDTDSHILEADVRSVKNKLEVLPQVKKVRVSRVFPSSIRIQIEERKPVALIIDNGIWGIDEEGVLLPRFRSKHGLDYPVIVSEKLSHHNPG
ncbi:FtsQ-type POTRA domain-containing protein, partial [candidate division KSB1 bacterium]|nr:FtsQ-type POTRA domain-containing protein [candidate division KSB1 bacterium]